jgi:hypothetical protein
MFLRRFLRTAFVAGLAAYLGTSAAACSGKKNTELVIAIQTDLRIPKDLDAISLEIADRNGNMFVRQSFLVGPDGLHLPATIGVVANDPSDVIDVTVTGQFGDLYPEDKEQHAHVIRRARYSFAEGRTGLVRLPLRFSCYDQSCGDGQSCVAGVCKVVSTIEGSTLPEFTAEQVYGPGADSDGNGGKCWDPVTCFQADIDLGAPNPGENGECFFPLPDHMPTDMFNVFMVVKDRGFCDASGTCRVVLDQDQEEGWHLDDTGKKVVLPVGLCTKLAAPGAKLQGGHGCEIKTSSLPLCDVDRKTAVGSGPSTDAGSDGSVIADDGLPDASDTDAGADDVGPSFDSGASSLDSGIDTCGLGPTSTPPTSDMLLAGYRFLPGSTTANMTGGPPLTFSGAVGASGSGMSCPAAGVSFDGTNYATATIATLDKASAFTVSAWVRASGSLPANGTIVSTAATSSGLELGTDASGVLTGSANIGGTLYTASATGFTVTDGWHQVVFQWQVGSPLRLFIDGSLRGSMSVPTTASFNAGTNLSIGRRSFAPAGKYWTGNLGDIRFYGK